MTDTNNSHHTERFKSIIDDAANGDVKKFAKMLSNIKTDDKPISRNTLYMYINGHRQIGMKLAERIRALGYNPDWIRNGTGSMKNVSRETFVGNSDVERIKQDVESLKNRYDLRNEYQVQALKDILGLASEVSAIATKVSSIAMKAITIDDKELANSDIIIERIPPERSKFIKSTLPDEDIKIPAVPHKKQRKSKSA